ncbi:hypothetical protein GCM10009687_68030 [Asanoa iriomotensis]|uniref:Uncharacterized protein n=2 Tax=Asanoa iriomotensis TaxID=234613 RepID=A0ABQ4C5D6_9ACTN|nr:hypothetical protein Air01nite_40920 [Asanoa iriomotensis]
MRADYDEATTSGVYPARQEDVEASGMSARVDEGTAALWLRENTVVRLRNANVRQAYYAWQQRNSHPVCPHAMIFLYSATEPHLDVYAGTRQTHDIATLRDPRYFVYQAVTEPARHWASTPQGLDPFTQLCDQTDDLPADAQRDRRFYGIALSTLDSISAPWAQQQAKKPSRLSGKYDLPGRRERPEEVSGTVLAYLRDGNVMVIDRRGSTEFNEIQIYTSAHLVTPHQQVNDWNGFPLPRGTGWSGVWDRMAELQTLLLEQEAR